MSDPFATAGELGQYLGLPAPSDLARWQQHLGAASAVIRGYCGQNLSQVAGDVVDLLPNGSGTLFLPELPVTAVSSVTVDAVAFTAFDFLENGELFRTDSFAWDDVATVTYDHGWAEFSPEYETLKLVCIQIASRTVTLNERSASEAMGGTIMETAGYSPEAFLTRGEMWQLDGLSMVGIG